jgi:O-antigen/teichoic acid export membrane protein
VRLLQPQDYGLVATAGLFTIFANLLLDGGLSLILVSERNLTRVQSGAALTWVVMVSIGLGFAIVVLAPLAAGFFHAPPLALVLQVSALQLPLWALVVVPQALLARDLRFRETAVSQMLGSVAQGVATLALAYNGAAYWALIVGTMVGTLIRLGAQWAFLSERPAPNFQFSQLRPLWSKSVYMLGQRAAYFFTGDFDTFVLGRLAGPAALGSYSLAKNLAHTALDQISGVVNQVSVPVFASTLDNKRAQMDGLLLLISTVSVLVFPLFWCMGLLSHRALPLILGSQWKNLVLPFMAFTFILPLRSLYTLLDSAVVGTGRVSTTFRNMLTWTVVMIPLLLFTARFGANGAAAAWVVGFPPVFWISMRRIAKVFGTDMSALLAPVVKPLLCAILSCVAVAAAEFALRNRLLPIPVLVIQCVAATAAYVLAMRLFARPQYDQTLELLWRLFGGRVRR